MKKSQRHLFFLTSIGHSYNDIFWFFIPLVLPILKEEFHLSYTQSGLILTFYTFTIAIFSFITGHLGDLYGRGRILSAGFILTAVSFTFFILLKSFFSILVILGVAAIGVSTFHSLAPPLLSEQFRSKKGIVFGIFESMGSVGILLMMCVFSLAVHIVGWRLICTIIALAGLPLAYAFYGEDVQEVSVLEQDQEIIHLQKQIVPFFLSRTLRTLGMAAIISFIPLFAVDVLGLSIQRASLLSAMMFVGAVVGALLTGWLSEHYKPFSIITVLLIVVLPVIFLLTLSLPLFAIILLLPGLGIAEVGFFPPQNIWLSQVSRRAVRGKMFGIGMTADGFVRALAPGLFGFFSDHWGLVTSFRWALLPIGVAATLFAMLRFTGAHPER